MERRRKFGALPDDDAWDDEFFAPPSLSTSPQFDRSLSTSSEPPMGSPRRSKRSDSGSSRGATVSPFWMPSLKRASLEIPCHLDASGALSSTAKSRVGVMTTVPVTRSLLATVHSQAGIRGRVGHASTHAELRYAAAPWASFTGGVVLAEKPIFEAGATINLRRQSTQLSVRLSSPKPDLQKQHDLSKDVSCKASWSQNLGSFITLRSGFGLSALSVLRAPTQQALQPASSASVSLSSRQTTHKWSTGLMWNRLDRRPKLVVSVSPRVASRIVSLSGWYNFWDASWSGTTGLSKLLIPQASLLTVPQLSVGWTRTHKEGWTYVVSWTWSGCTVRMPITLSTALLDPFWYPLQLVYATAVSAILQDVLELVLRGTEARNVASEHQATTNGMPQPAPSSGERRAKAQRDAANQQLLMRRTAHSRTEREREREGLVIVKALYHTPLESLDVTVPLQFWVADSVLELGAASKKDLLGFYDLSYKVPTSKDRPAVLTSWWAGFWSPIHRSNNGGKDAAAPAKRITPLLRVEYSFHGESHVAVVKDHEPLTLPSQGFVN